MTNDIYVRITCKNENFWISGIMTNDKARKLQHVLAHVCTQTLIYTCTYNMYNTRISEYEASWQTIKLGNYHIYVRTDAHRHTYTCTYNMYNTRISEYQASWQTIKLEKYHIYVRTDERRHIYMCTDTYIQTHIYMCPNDMHNTGIFEYQASCLTAYMYL